MSDKYVPPFLRQQVANAAAAGPPPGSFGPAGGGAVASPTAARAASPSSLPAAAAGGTFSPSHGAALPSGVPAAPRSPGLLPQRELQQQQQQQQIPRRRGLDALLSETAGAAGRGMAPAAGPGEGEAALLHPPHTEAAPGGGGGGAGVGGGGGEMYGVGRPRAPSVGSPSPTASLSPQPMLQGERAGPAGVPPGPYGGQQQQMIPPQQQLPQQQQQPSTTTTTSAGGGASPQQQQQQNRWSQVLMGHTSSSAASRGGRQSTRGGPGATPGGGLRVVEVDGLVLLKVLKHCRENFPTPVNGQLLGVDSKDRLEVTNCFPLPQKKDILAQLQRNGETRGAGERELEERLDEEFDKYQDKMAELMHDVNVDCFTVGWYQTLSFQDLTSKHLIDSLVLYQEEIQKAIVLGVDPTRSAGTGGKAAFKAYRVHPDFLAKYHECEQDVSKYNRLKAKDILIEVAIVVVNPFLVEAFLMDWASQDPLLGLGDFDSLEVDQSSYLEKNLLLMSSALESVGEEQERLQRYQREYLKQQQLQKHLLERRRLENEQRRLRGEPVLPVEMEGPAFRKIDPPSQLHTLLMSSQAQLQCEEVNTACCETLSKMFLLHWANTRKRSPAAASVGLSAFSGGGGMGGGAMGGPGGNFAGSNAVLRA